MTPERAREIAAEFSDDRLGPIAHNAALYETCGDEDPFAEIREVVIEAILRACAEEAAWQQELVCFRCGKSGEASPLYPCRNSVFGFHHAAKRITRAQFEVEKERRER